MTTRLAPPKIPKLPSAPGHVIGFVLFVGGVGMIVSALVELIYGGPHTVVLAGSGLAIGLPGLAAWRTTEVGMLRAPTVSAAVVLSWVCLSLASTIPYMLTGTFDRLDDALFESISGLTTTGATLLVPIEVHSEGILFWRALTQWFGGMGVIVLAVAILPFLGVGGLDLLRMEPGPASGRLSPRVRETAKRLWILYGCITLAMVAAYMVGGMNLYEAFTHAFTTVSTGGFTPYDASMAHFESATIEWVAIVGMAVCAGSFALYWQILRGRPGPLLRSTELRAYLGLLAALTVLAIAWNVGELGFTHDVVRGTVFSVVSVATTTGYATTDFAQWAPAPQLILLFYMALGGMTGSTAGGFKVFRLLAVLAYARRQVTLQLHPRAVAVVRLGREVVAEDVVARVVGFFGLFMAIGATTTFVVAALGADMFTSISVAASALGNIGPALGAAGPEATFHVLHPAGRMVAAAAMIIGRLEIYPVLITLLAGLNAARRARRSQTDAVRSVLRRLQ